MRFDAHTLVVLVRPPDAPELSEDAAAAVQDAHLAYQADLADRGLLVVAGPLTDQTDERLRGICVLATDLATARALYGQDPAVQAGRLAVEAMTWLVPAGGAAFTAVRLPRSTAEV
ncbi:YciI family protein [Asanoa sp. WMMD1127]|uniref:YciI family protein n=1 Tax=Asanoa sp. WMMD1127 TaxID=3016107 RepID=UPI0024177BF8|nr:YciI family protein [Asanoa sp. WMMD1127]MDG4824234.1 YciI family protein [Asanoa sp. WMMD1127]